MASNYPKCMMYEAMTFKKNIVFRPEQILWRKQKA